MLVVRLLPSLFSLYRGIAFIAATKYVLSHLYESRGPATFTTPANTS
jgi:hypothetical protein